MQRNRNAEGFGEPPTYEARTDPSRTPRNADSPRMDQSHSAEMTRRPVLLGPQSSTDKYRRTPQSSGSAGRSESQSEECKRKQPVTPSISTPEKVRRTAQPGRFVNTLIGQWVQQTGAQVAVPQPETPGNSSMELENESQGQECEAHRHALRFLKKKLHEAQEAITELYARRDSDMKLKDEIVTKLNANWESVGEINKFSDYIIESQTVFQQQYDSLSALYNDVIVAQRAAMQKLQHKLDSVRLKDGEGARAAAVMEERLKVQEQQMVEIQRDLKKQVEEAEKRLRMVQSHSETVQAEEKLKWTQERNALIIANEQLEAKLQQIENDNKSITDELIAYKSKLDHLARQHAELKADLEASALRESKLAEELESKTQQFNTLEKYLGEQRKLADDLARNVETISNNYTAKTKQHETLQTNFAELQCKLQELELRNTELEKSTVHMKTSSKGELAELKKTIETLKKSETALRDDRNKLQTSYTGLQHKLEEMDLRNAELEKSARNLKANNKAEVSELKKMIETLKKSETALRDERTKIQNKAEAELTKLKNDSLAKHSEVEAKQYAEIQKLKESLAKSRLENQTLQEKNENFLEELDQVNRMLIAAEVKSTLQSETKETSSMTPKNHMHLPPRSAEFKRSFAMADSPEDRPTRISASQPVRAQKNVRFDNLNILDPDVFVYSPKSDESPVRPDSSQLVKETDKKESKGADSSYKFFKSRGAVTKQYRNIRKLRERK